ncbi:TPA_asm: bacterial toxin-antitoxin, HicA-like [Porphyromonas phage phage024a_F0570]|uniref:Bacterial toxin-antitoxin, HicA-like n=1 Tax=Porphyromonas phage phage024a_F0570 TaxID=3154114 RepID=A0AAT9JLN7_9CAUD
MKFSRPTVQPSNKKSCKDFAIQKESIIFVVSKGKQI